MTVATVVDHVVEHKGDPALFFSFDNTQSLCDQVPFRCHSSRKQSIERRGFDNAVGADGFPVDACHPANRRVTPGGVVRSPPPFRQDTGAPLKKAKSQIKIPDREL